MRKRQIPLEFSQFLFTATIVAMAVLLSPATVNAQSSLCTAWDSQVDLPFIFVADGDQFILQHNGSANAGERFLWI